MVSLSFHASTGFTVRNFHRKLSVLVHIASPSARWSKWRFDLLMSVNFVQLARGFGNLMKQGWRPRRTIVLCSWDAEEFGLVCLVSPLKHAVFV